MNKAYFQYLFSEKREFYKQLGKKHNMTGWKAYRIAHGKRARSLKEYLIYLELHRTGMIS
mgnify:CR=1 FL=1|jgi:hypothetical protein